MTNKALLAVVAYMASIPAANWAISNVGTVTFPGGPHTIPVGFGYSAPSGVLLIGLALAARDAVHRLAGRRASLIAIGCGIVLSYVVNPALATASAVAFGLGELCDLAVFVPLARRSLPTAIVASGVVGGVIDTFVFLQIAFGSTMFWQGQVIGKTAVAAISALAVVGYRVVSQRLSAE